VQIKLIGTDVNALERVRAAVGARSGAEAVRGLIREAEGRLEGAGRLQRRKGGAGASGGAAGGGEQAGAAEPPGRSCQWCSGGWTVAGILCRVCGGVGATGEGVGGG
jgi:hypothetical protein